MLLEYRLTKDGDLIEKEVNTFENDMKKINFNANTNTQAISEEFEAVSQENMNFE